MFVHPTAVADDDRPGYSIPNFIAEYPFDTTCTIISLIFNGLFERHRHGWPSPTGGTIPMLGLRLTATADAAKAFGPALGLPSGSSVLTAKSPARALRTSFFDTALVADQPALAAAKKMAGASQIVFGSDWPFASRLYAPKGDPQPTLSEVFAAGERRAIDRLDARGEFPRLAKFVPRVPDEAAGDASRRHRRNVPRDRWVSLPAALQHADDVRVRTFNQQGKPVTWPPVSTASEARPMGVGVWSLWPGWSRAMRSTAPEWIEACAHALPGTAERLGLCWLPGD